MADIINSDGVSATDGEILEYSGQYYEDWIAEQTDGHYVIRFADAYNGVASLNDNSAVLYGSSGIDHVPLNVQINASYDANGSHAQASSRSNYWFVDLGDGDDVGVMHTLAYAVGTYARNIVSYDTSTLLGGGGNDLLTATQFGSSDGAWLLITDTSRTVDGGDGNDVINARDQVGATQGGFAGSIGNYTYLGGGTGADSLSSGVILNSQSSGRNPDGNATAHGNFTSADGGEGDDVLSYFLSARAAAGWTAFIVSNTYFGYGGDGNGTLNFDLALSLEEGVAAVGLNTAYLDGGTGSDTIQIFMGEGTTENSAYAYGGDGNDLIYTIDYGSNFRFISGGAGDDTIIDLEGFSAAVFDGSFSDYTITAQGDGWIYVVDNRSESPEGGDRL